jgi:pimeloyl-ACP methyl ester carboxylesterase
MLATVAKTDKTAVPGAEVLELTVAGIRTHLLRAGKGEPLLLLHGLGASSYSWRFAVGELARDYEVFVPDFPGFGRSEKPWDFDYSIDGLHAWLLALMDELGIKSARMAGNSMGGVIALCAAMRTPERVERMALIGTPAYPENRPRALWPLGWPVVGRILEASMGETSLRWIVKATFFDQSKITDEMIAEYGEPLKTAHGRRAVAQFIRRAIPADFAERIKKYKDVPHRALVLVGEADRMVGPSGAARLARDLPNARYVCLDRCGHAPQEDAPERVNAILREFLAG